MEKSSQESASNALVFDQEIEAAHNKMTTLRFNGWREMLDAPLDRTKVLLVAWDDHVPEERCDSPNNIVVVGYYDSSFGWVVAWDQSSFGNPDGWRELPKSRDLPLVEGFHLCEDNAAPSNSAAGAADPRRTALEDALEEILELSTAPYGHDNKAVRDAWHGGFDEAVKDAANAIRALSSKSPTQ